MVSTMNARDFADTLGPMAGRTVVRRGGEVVFDGGQTRQSFDVHSVSKSFTATALGLLIGDGACSLDDRAAETLPFLAERYGDVTLRHLATMTSGYNAHGAMYPPDRPTDGSRTFDVPAEPLFEPGVMWHYHDDAVRVLGLCLERIAGRTMVELLDLRVMPAVGVDGWRWTDYQHTGKGSDAGSGVWMSSRELAAWGEFWRRGCDGLLPAGFIADATSHRTAGVPTYRGGHYRHIDVADHLGYLWREARPFPTLGDGAFYIRGWACSHLFVAPALDLVVARAGYDPDLSGDDIAGTWARAFDALLDSTA